MEPDDLFGLPWTVARGERMSRGSDGRETQADRKGPDGDRHKPSERNSRTSVRMSIERARSIQSHADRTGAHQGFKARAMSAAAQNSQDATGAPIRVPEVRWSAAA